MDKAQPQWNSTIKRLLESAAYDLSDPNSIAEICARTGLEKVEVLQVLEGSRNATVEGVYRIASMLNVPPADVLNPSRRVIQCHSVDGGRPRTLSVTAEDSTLLEHINGLPLLYADGIDGSYTSLKAGATVIFANISEQLEVGRLYLLENDAGRYVRRCQVVDISKGTAFLSSGHEQKGSRIRIDAFGRVTPDTEHVLGRVLLSVNAH